MGIFTWLFGALLLYQLACKRSVQQDDVSTPYNPTAGKVPPDEDMSKQEVTEKWDNVSYTDIYSTGTVSMVGERDHLYVVSDRLFLVSIPILTAVGVLGNVLTMVTAQRRRLRESPISVYMTALACADSLVLILDFLNNWIFIVTGVHVISTSLDFCQAYNFLFTTLYTYAAWLVACIACERCLVVWWPLKAKWLSTRNKSLVAVCVSLVLCGIIHSYNFLIWDIREGRCDMNVEQAYFFYNIYPWLSGVVYSYLPVTIIIVCNVLILVGLRRAAEKRKALSQQENQDTRSLTITMVTICVTFVVTTVPLTIFYAVLLGAGQFVQQTPAMALGRTIILILGLANHSANFFLYVMTSSKFREELRGACGLRAGGGTGGYQARESTEDGGRTASVATVGTSLSMSQL